MLGFPLRDASHEVFVGMFGEDNLQFNEMISAFFSSDGTPLPRSRRIVPVFEPFGIASSTATDTESTRTLCANPAGAIRCIHRSPTWPEHPPG